MRVLIDKAWSLRAAVASETTGAKDSEAEVSYQIVNLYHLVDIPDPDQATIFKLLRREGMFRAGSFRA